MNIGIISLVAVGLFRKLFQKKNEQITQIDETPYTGHFPNVVELDSLPSLEVPPETFSDKIYLNDIPLSFPALSPVNAFYPQVQQIQSQPTNDTSEPTIDSIVYYNMTVKELRQVAKSKNIKNYFTMKKHELIEIILNN